MNRSGTIGIDFDDIVFPNGERAGLVGSLTSDDPATRRRIDDENQVSGGGNKRPAVFIGGGGAVGAVLGGIAGGGKGAVLGGIAGAGAGVAGVLLSKGEEAQVPAGTPFGVQLRQPLIIREAFLSEAAPETAAPQPADRTDRGDPVGSQPDIVDRPATNAPEREARPEPEGPIPADQPLSSPEMVRRAQSALKDQGYYEGEIDGTMNPRTSNALRTYQREHKLQETGDLDPQTAKSLGILGAPRAGERPAERQPAPRRESSEPSDSVMANVTSANAGRTADGAISVVLNTQANTGGWRWFGGHVVNGDTLEVYARAVRPSGMVTQALTRGRIDLTVRDGVEYVRRVVIHSAGPDQVISLVAGPEDTTRTSGSAGLSAAADALERKAEDLLAEYQRVCGVRMTGTGVELENASSYREPEIELLFAIDSFANAAQLYSRLANSLRDRESIRGATLSMARQARRTDRVMATTTSAAGRTLGARWDSIRQDVLALMRVYNVDSSEIEN
jgi:peptidoglycan hydrolase-like protein with peptidoglycan-binding domain